jgi:hypothetical protein
MSWSPANYARGGAWVRLNQYVRRKGSKALAQSPPTGAVLLSLLGDLQLTASSVLQVNTPLTFGALASTFDSLITSLTGQVYQAGSLAGSLSALTASGSAKLKLTASRSGTLGDLAGSLTGALKITGTATLSLDALTSSSDSGSGLATPTLTNYSDLGTAPLVLEWSTTDYVAGLRAQLQIDYNSDFSSPEQNIIFFLDGASWSSADADINLATPVVGTAYYARIRTLRDNESGATAVTGNDPLGNALSFQADASGWSDTFTDTNLGNTTAYRYYRIYMSAGNSGTGVCTIGEIELASTIGGADTTSGQTFTASDQETSLDSGAVANAFDDNATTFWESHISGTVTAFPHWIQADYGATSGNWKAINQLKVSARSNNGSQAPKDFVLQGSADASAWTDIITVTGATGWANGETRTYTT